MRPFRRALLPLALTAVLAPVPHVTADPPQDCFWTSVFDEQNANLFYPDTGVNYYAGRVALAPTRRSVTPDSRS